MHNKKQNKYKSKRLTRQTGVLSLRNVLTTASSTATSVKHVFHAYCHIIPWYCQKCTHSPIDTLAVPNLFTDAIDIDVWLQVWGIRFAKGGIRMSSLWVTYDSQCNYNSDPVYGLISEDRDNIAGALYRNSTINGLEHGDGGSVWSIYNACN